MNVPAILMGWFLNQSAPAIMAWELTCLIYNIVLKYFSLPKTGALGRPSEQDHSADVSVFRTM